MAKMLSPLFTWRGVVVQTEGLSATAKHTALTLSMYMSERGDSCFPSLQQLADDMSRGRSTVSAGIAELEKAGLLVVRRSDGGRNKRNEYVACVVNSPEAEHSVVGNSPEADVNSPEAEPQVPRQYHASSDSSLRSESPKRERSLKQRQRDDLWEALNDVFGEPRTKSEDSRRGSAVSELVALEATPDEVREKGRDCLRRFAPGALANGAVVTEKALLAHWSKLGQVVSLADRLAARSDT